MFFNSFSQFAQEDSLWKFYTVHGVNYKVENLGNNRCIIERITNDTLLSISYYGYFKNDSIVFDGKFLLNNKKNNVRTEGFYKDGEKTQNWLNYKNDKLYSIHNYQDSNNIMLTFFRENGEIQIISHILKDGTPHGPFIEFDTLSQVQVIGNFENNCKVGEWSYFKNGKLHYKGEYYPDYLELKSNGSNNTMLLVNKEGILAEKIYSKQVMASYVVNQQILYIKDGKWYFFNNEGKLIKIEYYKNGILIKTKTII